MDNEQRRFKRAEMDFELAHEEPTISKSIKSMDYQKFTRLKTTGDKRDEIEEMQFLALKKRYNWF